MSSKVKSKKIMNEKNYIISPQEIVKIEKTYKYNLLKILRKLMAYLSETYT